MARSETVVSVFVASPADVSPERDALEHIVSELNRSWSQTLNLRFELIRWESNAYPGIGDYPQEVINRQVGLDYDVLIAIFWSKVGTPTARAESGTIEEINNAYEKYLRDKDSIDILIYFKDEAIPPSKMDPVQLQNISDLKRMIGDRGALYWSFDSTEDFEQKVRGHLSRVAQEWSKKLKHTPSYENGGSVEHIEETEDGLEEEFGILDYLEVYEQESARMNLAISKMSDATERIGKQFSEKLAEVERLKSFNGTIDPKRVRVIVVDTCGYLDEYSELIEVHVIIAHQARIGMFDAMSKAISISVEIGHEEDDLSTLKSNLVSFVGQAGYVLEKLSHFRNNVQSLPKLTITLNKSKRRTVRSLDKVMEELGSLINSANGVIKTIFDVENAS